MPDRIDLKLLGASSVNRPQHLQAAVTYPPLIRNSSGGLGTPGEPCVMTVYTGILGVGHVFGDELDPDHPNRYYVHVLHPLIAHIRMGPGGALGILPILEGRFRGAVGSASIANFVDRTDPCVVTIMETHVDLRRVILSNGSEVNAVVLDMLLRGQNTDFHSVAYNVTVLTSTVDMSPVPVLFDRTNWDGEFRDASLSVKNGVPQW